MGDSSVVIGLSFIMFIGSIASGLVPLAFHLSETSLQLVSTFGAGLLVGAALAVIIPEGVNMLYMDKTHATEAPNVTTQHDHAESNIHSVIGASLVLGFVFMMLVDQISHARKGSDGSSQKSFTATLGLVVHAAADGIALGAAVITSQKDVEVIVFLAIMLHKAPAAFGLVTFLMHEGLQRNNIRKHLLTFSAAAPIAAIITFYGLSQENKATLSTLNGTGVAMLFSAGTFLYVATVHVLPEIAYGHGSHASSSDSLHVEKNGFTRTELLCLVTGSILPLCLSAFHSH